MKQTVHVKGMSCPHCVAHVKEALSELDGVKSVEVSLSEGTAVVESETALDKKVVYDVLLDWGYEVTSID